MHYSTLPRTLSLRDGGEKVVHASMWTYVDDVGFEDIEHKQLEEKTNGKLARAELDRIAREDERRARTGLVELRHGEEVWYKPLEELTLYERQYRLEAEKAWNRWLRSRVERMKSERDHPRRESF